LAEKRVYEVIFIIDPDTPEDDSTRLIENLQHTVADQGGTITKTENMGRRQLAYKIGHKNDGNYMMFEIEGSGREIAELERRMRVNDAVIRYMTIRVDLGRPRAEKLSARRPRKASSRPAPGARRGSSAPVAAPVAAAPRVVDESEA